MPLARVKNKNKKYEDIQPDVTQWAIYKLSTKRYEFIQEVHDTTLRKCLDILGNNENLQDELARSLFQERVRLTEKPWKADPPDEKEYWSQVKKSLVQIPSNEDRDDKDQFQDESVAIASSIISRYSNEIAGNFDPNVHDFAKVIVPFGFSRLLKTSVGENFKDRLGKQFSMRDRIKFLGDIETIRTLAKDHTMVFVPTHSSNLDSMLIGWAINEIGLPAVIYGAGLNLFGIRLLAYLMNRLGAYKVDRRKKNLFYLETLKTYSELALHKEVHSLFFPGGTRSRSGEIEQKLKLGLLGTAMEAQYRNYLNETHEHKAKKIIIVPVVMNYHFILEAPSLVEQYLKETGREQYLTENDQFSTSFKIFRFIIKFLTQSSKIYLSFAPCMDLFGNKVDKDGASYDKHGHAVDVKKYFISDGELVHDKQRNDEYNKLLGEHIAKSYLDYNVVFSSYLVAFAAYQILKKRFKRMDLYALLRLPQEDRTIDYDLFVGVCNTLRSQILKLKKKKKIKIAKHMKRKTTEEIVEHGLRNLGLYHDKRPLIRNKQGEIVSQDMKLLMFYQNRLEGYNLDRFI